MNYFIVGSAGCNGDCETMLYSDSECGTVPDNDSKVEQCRTMMASGIVPDSTSEHGMYSMGTIINYNLSDVTVTNYGKFLSLLMCIVGSVPFNPRTYSAISYLVFTGPVYWTGNLTGPQLRSFHLKMKNRKKTD
jgi:hypothetical protein